LKLPTPNPTEKSIIEDVKRMQKFMLVGFTSYCFLDDAQNQNKLLSLLWKIIDA
jgi:hypothetical protein